MAKNCQQSVMIIIAYNFTRLVRRRGVVCMETGLRSLRH